MKILATFQRSSSIAGQKSADSESIKDVRLKRFIYLASQLGQLLLGNSGTDQDATFFDYVDPASGSLMLSAGSGHVMSEVEIVETFLTGSHGSGFKVV